MMSKEEAKRNRKLYISPTENVIFNRVFQMNKSGYKSMCRMYFITLVVIAIALVPIAAAQPIPPSKYIVSYEEVIDSNAYADLYISMYAKIDEIEKSTNLNRYTLTLMPPRGVIAYTDTRAVFVIVDNPCVGETRLDDQKRFTIDTEIGIPLTKGDDIVIVGKPGKFLGMRRDIRTGSEGTIILLLSKEEYEGRKDMIFLEEREISPGVIALGSADLSLLEDNVQLLGDLVRPKGNLSVSSSPSGASIYVKELYGDLNAGATPVTLYGLPEGPHTIKLRKSGYEDLVADVTVTANITTTVSYDLNRILEVLGEKTVIANATQWLRAQQKEDGDYAYWHYHGTANVGITALVTLALLNHGYGESDPTVKGALNWLVAQANKDGSISCGDLKVYDTSLAILPLVAAHNEAKYGEAIENARDYLISMQNNEGTDYDPSDSFYGGWGDPSDNEADLSNTQFVLTALDAAGGLTGEVKDNALAFVTRCQNREESNAEYSSYDDGGFVNQPDSGEKSWGSMTAVGLWSLFLCGVDNDDGRIKDALSWLDAHNVRRNDPIGNKWVYYYDLGLAKAYMMAEAKGCEFGKRGWYEYLYAFLNEAQKDNHWRNIEGEQSCDVLATAEAILALEVKEVPANVSRLSYLVFKLRSAANLHIYDPMGRHVGLDYETGEVEIGIADATYTTKTTEIKGPNLEAGGYKAVLIGTEAGDYVLEVLAKTDKKTIAEASYDGWITKGAMQEMVTTVSSIVGPLDVRIGRLEAVVEAEDSYSEQFSLEECEELEIDAIDDLLLRIEAEEECEGEVTITEYSKNPTTYGFPGKYKYYALEKYWDISLDVDKEKIDWPIYLEIQYDEDELPKNVDERTLILYRYGDDRKWSRCDDFEVNPEEDYISAELEKDELSYFGIGGLYEPIWVKYSVILALMAIVIVLAVGYFSVRRSGKSRGGKAKKVPGKVPEKVPEKVPGKVPEKVPITAKVSVYNFGNSLNLLKEREETTKILDGLDGRLASGEIKEETHNDLRPKYASKLEDIDGKIKSELERAITHLQQIEDEQTKLQNAHDDLNAELQKEEDKEKKAVISARINGISAEIERFEGIIKTMKEKIGVMEEAIAGD
jgi:hypothetical protein